MPKKILVVDDEEGVRQLLMKILEDLGFEVFGATDGEDALSWLATEEFAVVFTDLKMPNMDGREFLLKAKEKNPRLPVVMITAHGTVETAVQTMREGATDFLLKPFPIPQIKV
ncbi:MAG: response regulator, partial [Planctomycetota bacterium]